MKNLKYYLSLLYPPHIWIPIIFYLLSTNKKIIKSDMYRWCQATGVYINSPIQQLSYLLLFDKPFRNLFYRRLGQIGKYINIILSGENTLFITSAPIGHGLFIRHGYATFINSKYIGKNCTIHQCTTIGDSGKGIPTIGDNVTIGAGCIILGPITIGNNVTIAAGSIVVNDVPSNSTVIGHKAIIKK